MTKMIEENKRRLKHIAAPYDPMTGEGSPIPRTLVEIPDSPLPKMWLPNSMLFEPAVQNLIDRGFRDVMAELGYSWNDKNLNLFWEDFGRIRNKYDYEWYARMCQTIQDKETLKDIPFILNRPQRKYLKQLEALRTSGKPIDIILLKARQWGGSTLTQLYMQWLQVVVTPGINSVICGDVENQSRIVAGMLTRTISHTPKWVLGCSLKEKPYMGSTSTREIHPVSSRFTIGSAQKPDKVRSENVALAHLTEVGLWKATKTKKPEDLVQAIFGTCLSGPGTMKVLESTAKGVGNYFHRTWLGANLDSEGKKQNNFTPVFISWYDIDKYSTPIDNYQTFIESMGEYEHFLFSQGATLEAINWYRAKRKEFDEHWRMCSEFPTTPAEAFQSTGRRVFRISYVQDARKTCLTPWWKGDIVNGEFVKGEGNLHVWYMPDVDMPMKNRYVVSVDVGGVSDSADYSCISVADRYPMTEGGVPEIVACWHGHIEHDKLAWKAVEIARAYDNALLVIEANTLETEGTEGNHFEYILNEIASEYSNLYSRTSEQQIKQGRPRKWGFHTNSSTKPMVIDFLNKALRDGLYIERCLETCNELDLFEYKENGRETGAVEGNHDDRVMATAILVWVCYNYPLPTVKEKHNSSRKKTRIISEASI